jgi:predicted Zn-dependent protease
VFNNFPIHFLSGLLFLSAISPARADETRLRSASLLETSRNDYRAGNLNGALGALDEIDKAGKRDSDALDLRGAIYLEEGKFEEAKRAFRAASEASATGFSPRLHLGDVFLREKKFPEAREIYGNLLRQTNIQTSNEKLRYAILLTYLFAKDESRARAALALIRFPTESPAYYYAQAAWEFARAQPEEAHKWMKAGDRMFDARASAWFARPLYDFGWVKEKPTPITP